MRTRTPLALLSTSAFVALAACGGGSDTETSEQLPDVPQGFSPLAAALDETSAATSFRTSMAMGMNMTMGAPIDMTMAFDADLDRAMMVIESDADGEQYYVMDLVPMMEGMFESMDLGVNPVDELGGDLSMEGWIDGTTMLLDVGGFGAILEQQAPGQSILPADRFTIDVAELGAGLGGPEIAAMLSGQTAPDPIAMAETLRDALDDVDGSGDAFNGTLDFAEMGAAFGQDPEALFGQAGGLAELGADPAAAEVMLDVFEQIQVDVDVTLADGAVDIVRFDIDMSALFEAMPEILDETGSPIPAEEADEAADVFENATFAMTMLFDYDLDDTIDVVVPSTDGAPDLTDDFLELFELGSPEG